MGIDPEKSASKDGKICNGDIIMSVASVSISNLEQASDLIEACSLSEATTLGMFRTTATIFHKEMPVNARHAGRYRVAINGQWLMSFLLKDLELTNEKTTTELEWTKIFFVADIDDTDPAWHCGVRPGDILLGINGHDVQKMDVKTVSQMIWEAREAGSSVLLMSRVTTPDAASFIRELGKRDEKSDDENEKKEDDLTLSKLGTKQKKRGNEDTEAGGDDINDEGTEVYIAGIGDIAIFHLEERLLACAKLDGKHVWSAMDFKWEEKQTNVSRISRIVNSHPNKKIKPRVKTLNCPDKHGVPIP